MSFAALLEIAKASQCVDLEQFSQTLQDATDEQRSLIRSVLDAQLVDEIAFLRGVSQWLELPWWKEPVATVAAPLRQKVPAKVALRYHVVSFAVGRRWDLDRDL